jgi:signal transduction histidine kinase
MKADGPSLLSGGQSGEVCRPVRIVERSWLPVLCALLQTLSVGTGDAEPAAGWAAVAFVLVGLASGLALRWRDRAALGTLAVVTVGFVLQVALGGPALPVCVTVMMYVVGRGAASRVDGRDRPFRWTATALVAGLLGVVGALLVFGHPDPAAPFGLVTVSAGLAGLLLALRSSRDEERRRELLTAERMRIARDLHDIVGHGLSAVTVQAGAARMAVAAGATAEATDSLAAIESAGRGMLREVRWLVGLLREEGGRPVLADVAELVGNARRSGLEVVLSVSGDLESVPPVAGEAAYRVVQEALTNVLRHGGRRAEVRVRVDDALDLRIIDAGESGAERAAGTAYVEGNGVRGMRERAGAVGGTLHAGPSPDGGWTVRALLPLGRRS